MPARSVLLRMRNWAANPPAAGSSPLLLWLLAAAGEAWLGALFLRHGWQPWTLAGLSGNLTLGLVHGLSTGTILWGRGGVPPRWIQACLLGWGGISVLNGVLTFLLSFLLPLPRDTVGMLSEWAVRGSLSGLLLGFTQSRALRWWIAASRAHRWVGVALRGSLVSWVGMALTLLLPWGTLPPLVVTGLESGLVLGSGLLGGLVTCEICGYWPTGAHLLRPGLLRALRTARLSARVCGLVGGCLLGGGLLAVAWPASMLLGSGRAVLSVAVSADGATLADLAQDGQVRLWRRADHRLQAVWELAAEPVRQGWVAFAPDGQTLAAGADTGMVQLWAVPSGRRLRQFATRAAVVGLAFTPDSTQLLIATVAGTVQIWQVADGRLLWTRVSGIAPLHSLTLAPSGDTFAVGGRYGAVSVGPVTTTDGVRPLRPPGPMYSLTAPIVPRAAPETGVAYTADGHTLVTSAYNYEFPGGTFGTNLRVPLGTLTVWSLDSVPSSRQIDLPTIGSWGYPGLLFDIRSLAALAVAPIRPIAALSIGTEVWLWRWDNGGGVTTLHGARADVTSLAFTPDGRLLIGGAQDGIVYFWDTHGY